MKKRSNLASKLELFYQKIESKREENGKKMRLQTDLEFQQNEIIKRNKKYNVDMFRRTFEVEKLLQQNKKLANLKNFF